VVFHGVRLAVHEWGREDAPPLLLAHGGFDFSRTFDVFAPLLAAGGWRVVSFDQRGHGDSDHAALYSWDADARDALAVLDSTTAQPVPFVGHSKGGAVLTHLAQSCPHRVTKLASIDGLPSRRPAPDIADHERTRLLADEVAAWLAHRRRAASRERKPGTLDELAARRGRMNPRLSRDWLRYLVSVGARRDADGWRWKIDPALRPGGFGPWRPEWTLGRLPGLSVPLLGLLASVNEPMGWDTSEDTLRPFLPPEARIVTFPETGHFIHIERPHEVASLVLEFLAA
jgi:pimeloyl-ACP methyl ester carboxylesterase